jgi:ketosteroid isomerase-like protein
MKLYCHFFILIALFACAGPPNGQDPSASEVLELEKKRFRAMVEGDVNFLQEVISEDLYYIHSNGEVDTKDSFIGPIANGDRRYDNISIETSKVRLYGNTAIINGECTYHRKNPDGAPNNLRLKYTNVYVKMDGNWKMVSWQSFKM